MRSTTKQGEKNEMQHTPSKGCSDAGDRLGRNRRFPKADCAMGVPERVACGKAERPRPHGGSLRPHERVPGAPTQATLSRMKRGEDLGHRLAERIDLEVEVVPRRHPVVRTCLRYRRRTALVHQQ